MTKDKNCIFCKIIAKEIQAEIVYEDEDFITFMDINPVGLGHILTIPKNHCAWMQDAPDETVSKIFVVCKKLMLSLKKAYSADYVKLLVAGNDVPHFHIHLIPRFLDVRGELTPRVKYKDKNEMKDYAEKIRAAL